MFSVTKSGEKTLQLLTSRLNAKNLKLTWKLTGPEKVVADETRTMHVLQNVLIKVLNIAVKDSEVKISVLTE